jgi:hypothetical protein
MKSELALSKATEPKSLHDGKPLTWCFNLRSVLTSAQV